MATIRIDANKVIKKMKPMHGGGQPPSPTSAGMYHYLTEAGIPFSRLHDVGGAFGGGRFVDVPNVFRNFDADETDPASYDFTFTDLLITNLIRAGVEPYYRLGVTIENQALIKPYHTVPPKDYHKWARICEHIIMHYTEGWADGFNYKIRYWEIWNEPEVQDKMMWNGTPEEFYELYSVTAKHLKARFPHLKIGGYSSCGFYAIAPVDYVDPTTLLKGTVPPNAHEQSLMDFFYGFFAYIKEHDAPIDFFSWHNYAGVDRVERMDAWLHLELEKLGYGGLETHLNEWNPYPQEFGTAHHSAEIAGMMLALQNGYTDLCCIYDMRANNAPYCPLFDIKTSLPIHGYYALAAFNRLYRLGNQVELECDTDRIYAVAASDGKRGAVMISNLTGAAQRLAVYCDGVDFAEARYYVIDQERLMSWAPHGGVIGKNAVMLIEWG